jgi:uncharacterized protein YkwD
MQNQELIRCVRRAALASFVAFAFAGCAPGGDADDGEIDEAASLTAEGGEADAPARDGGVSTSAVPVGPAGEVFALVNQARAQARVCGTQSFAAAPALVWDDRLGKAAQGHSTDMAVNNYFSHTSLDGRTFVDRVKAQGYTSFSSLGENIAAGQPTAAQVVNAWLKSPGHCKNIMNPKFRDLGVGHATGGTFGVYWTQDFGRQF